MSGRRRYLPVKKDASKQSDSLDAAFLEFAEAAFDEWNSPEDEAAFADLGACRKKTLQKP
jgi:hypothetical protein